MVNKKSKKNQNQNQENANTNLNRNGNNVNARRNTNARSNVNNGNSKKNKSRRSNQKRQQRKSVQKQQEQGRKNVQKRKGVQKNKQVKRRRSLNRTNQRNNKRKRSKKNSNKRRRRQRGGYTGLDYSVLPGGVDAETGVWTADFDSTADFGILGSNYQGEMLRGAEVGVRSQFEGTVLSDDTSVFEQVDSEEGRMSAEDARAASDQRASNRSAANQNRHNDALDELGRLSTEERRYHAAYDRYDSAPTDATTKEKEVSEDDLDILEKHGADNGADNVARADRFKEIHDEYKDKTGPVDINIKELAHDLHQDYKEGDGRVAPARNFPPE